MGRITQVLVTPQDELKSSRRSKRFSLFAPDGTPLVPQEAPASLEGPEGPEGPPGDPGPPGEDASVEDWHVVGASGEPSFGGGISSPSNPLKFRKDSLGRVHIRGEARKGSAPDNTQTLFVLPAGYRPSSQLQWPIATWSNAPDITLGRLMVDTDGYVYRLGGDRSGGGTYGAPLGEITFFAD
jgi:hypothetical protein